MLKIYEFIDFSIGGGLVNKIHLFFFEIKKRKCNYGMFEVVVVYKFKAKVVCL
jgi:hypothetical protein